MEIDNGQDILDLRDIQERVHELESDKEIYFEEGEPVPLDLKVELAKLLNLLDECDDPDNEPILIRDSYFKDYAQELADDLGLIQPNTHWPYSCIDWDRAARDLRMDYHSVDYDGVEYWQRS